MELIDKDALVAKIEKQRQLIFPQNTGEMKVADVPKPLEQGWLNALSWMKKTIDSLEVKEVDIEKEINKYISDNFFGSETIGFFAARTKEEPNDIDMALCAKHFFELGIKAQHDNWKVVDNINPPQADKNKIYCVFTKDRHILATVINHPKDEELLQWKCTEFPHHRYDMCEGDKYMQIV